MSALVQKIAYPTLSAHVSQNIDNVLKFANDDSHPKQADFSQFVHNAIDVAKNPAVTEPSPTGLDGWRTTGSGSPGDRFVLF